MRQIRTLSLSLVVALVVVAAQGVAASPPSSQSALQSASSKFLSQKDIERSGGYRLSVPGRGEFKVVRLGSPKNPTKKCLVETASLKRLIAAAPEADSPTAGRIIIELRAYTGGTCPADTICCSGSGNGCSVEVVIVQKPSGGGRN